MQEIRLADLRKRKEFTQSELGQKVAELLGKQWTESYAQKKVSNWESGEKPTPEECRALSRILEIPYEQILHFFGVQTSNLVENLFAEIAASPNQNLLITCFSGKPAAPLKPELLSTIEGGLKNNLCYAMVVPYPTEPGMEKNDGIERLEIYYKSVFQAVKGFRNQLRNNIENKDKIAFFIPKETRFSFLLPPFRSRYVVRVQKPSNNKIDELSLYLWIRTAEIDQLQPVGITGIAIDETTLEEIQHWEAYFAELISLWRDHECFSEEAIKGFESSCWQVVP